MEEQTSGKRIQLSTTFIINILALATGASFGIANVLISDLQPLAKNDSSLVRKLSCESFSVLMMRTGDSKIQGRNH